MSDPISAASSGSLLLAQPPAFAPVRQRSAHISSNDAEASVAISFGEAHSPGVSSPSSKTRRCASITRIFRGRNIIYVIMAITMIMFVVVSVPIMHRMPVNSIHSFSGTMSVPSDSLTLIPGRSLLVDGASKSARISQYNARGKHHLQGTCKNSRSGKYMLADDRGSVCLRGDLDEGSGCCSNPIGNMSCDSCRSDLRCCQSFEYCISCCLKGSDTSSPNGFDQCVETCRTSSRSIKHGNMYKHSFHHCYTKEEGQLEVDSSAITNVQAEPGFSCDQTCSNLNDTRTGVTLTCIDSVLQLMNDCAAMKSVFACDRCEMSEGADQPAFVPEEAPANFPRGACLLHKNSKAVTCDGRHEATQRGCSCTLPIDLPI